MTLQAEQSIYTDTADSQSPLLDGGNDLRSIQFVEFLFFNTTHRLVLARNRKREVIKIVPFLNVVRQGSKAVCRHLP